jgi:hypothetical protein
LKSSSAYKDSTSDLSLGQNSRPDLILPEDDFGTTGLAQRLAGLSPRSLESFSPPSTLSKTSGATDATPKETTSQPSTSLRSGSESKDLPPGTKPAPSVIVEYHATTRSGESRGANSRQHPRPNNFRTQNTRSVAPRRRETYKRVHQKMQLEEEEEEETKREWTKDSKIVFPPTTTYFETADLESLFRVSPSEFASVKVQAKSQRIQLVLERTGGDYSRLLPETIDGIEESPVNRARSAMARRRDIGINRRIGALRVVESVVGKEVTQSEPHKNSV